MDNRSTILSARLFQDHNDEPLVEVDLRDLEGTMLLGRRGQLQFTIRLVFKGSDAYRQEQTVLQLWAETRVSGPGNTSMRSPGRAAIVKPVIFKPEQPTRIGGRHDDPWTRIHDPLTLDLDFWQLDEIERKRQGGSLTFTFTRGGVAYHGGKVGMLYPDNHQVQYQVATSDWHQTLANLGYGTFVNVEVPLTSPNGLTGDVQKAAQALEQAQAAFRRGDYEEAVADCRPGLEALDTVDKGKFNLKPWDRNASKDERFYWVRRSLLSITHAAHHPTDPALATATTPESRPRWEREDAEVVITVLATLLRCGLATAQ